MNKEGRWSAEVKISKKWFIFCIALIFFIVFTYLVVMNQIEWFDNLMYRQVRDRCSIFGTDFFLAVTSLVHPLVLILITGILMMFLKSKKLSLLALLNLCFIGGLNIVLKAIFMRERPIDFLLFKEQGYSYPSAHSMVGMCFYGFFIYLIWQSNWKKRDKIICSVLLGMIIFLIGLSRIYFRVHYPSDVFAGFSVSLVYLILFTHMISKKWS